MEESLIFQDFDNIVISWNSVLRATEQSVINLAICIMQRKNVCLDDDFYLGKMGEYFLYHNNTKSGFISKINSECSIYSYLTIGLMLIRPHHLSVEIRDERFRSIVPKECQSVLETMDRIGLFIYSPLHAVIQTLAYDKNNHDISVEKQVDNRKDYFGRITNKQAATLRIELYFNTWRAS